MDEGRLGLPQTPYYKDLDRREILIKNEINFTKVIIQPLWSVLNEFLDNEVELCLRNSNENVELWGKTLEEIEKKLKSNEKNAWIEPIKESKDETLKTEGEEEPVNPEKIAGNAGNRQEIVIRRETPESSVESERENEEK